MKPFAERCREEATRDVVFLFQKRKFTLINEPEGYTYSDGYLDINDAPEDDEKQYISLKEAFELDLREGDWDMPCVLDGWRTEGVWLTREEAEAHGQKRAYNYPDGWRVYGVPANGTLAKVLVDT